MPISPLSRNDVFVTREKQSRTPSNVRPAEKNWCMPAIINKINEIITVVNSR